MASVSTQNAFTQLQATFKGEVFSPHDAGYDEARKGWNRFSEQYPAYILVVQDVEDVMAAVRFAHEVDLGVSIRATGHGIQQVADGQVLIVTSRLNEVEVRPHEKIARVGGGTVWKDVLEKSMPHGLAPLLGSAPHVGVVGYSLGGGIGWLARRYGLAVDSVRAVEIVTPDGVLRRASLHEHSDLFWGVRGGSGGNFGVVTAIEFNLYPVARFYGGTLTYAGNKAAEALAFFREWVKTVPHELTSSITLLKIPALLQVPTALHGKIKVLVRAVYVGEASEGQRYLQGWLDWATPDANDFAERPFAEIGEVSQDGVEPVSAYSSNALFNALDDEAIEVIVRRASDPNSPLTVNEIRHAGGAIRQVDPQHNAMGHREAEFYLQLGALLYRPNHARLAKDYIAAYKADLSVYLSGVYLNFLKGDEAAQYAKDAFSPETYQRLQTLKASYDPHNRFRFSYQLVDNT